MVLLGQALRSTAMIHASTNFSHSVAFQKRDTHRLVTDGVYRLEVFSFYRIYPFNCFEDGFVIRHMLVFITGRLVLN
jgi:protein-S-isoprenylcysteine O-methyltransferase